MQDIELSNRIENDFTYHPPKPDQIERYTKIRQAFKELALLLVDNCPRSRELSAAYTLLQESNMMANASIAVNE